MKEYITIETRRNGYSVDQCGRTLTVAELVSYLEQWDEDTPVYFSNDGGYTYGSINFDDINSRIADMDEDNEDDEE